MDVNAAATHHFTNRLSRFLTDRGSVAYEDAAILASDKPRLKSGTEEVKLHGRIHVLSAYLFARRADLAAEAIRLARILAWLGGTGFVWTVQPTQQFAARRVQIEAVIE